MTRSIETAGIINWIRLKLQGSNPASPASGYDYLFTKSDGLYHKNAAGTVKGPLGDASGPASATDGHLAVFDSTSGKLIKDGGAVPGASDYICIRDQKEQNTAGGTFTAGAWRTRDLNIEVSDTGNHASVASNQITLAAGTYIVRASAPGFECNSHQARLWNVTGSALLVLGDNARAQQATASQSYSTVSGKFTLAIQSVIELQHYCMTTAGYGLAVYVGVEVYSTVELWKVG